MNENRKTALQRMDALVRWSKAFDGVRRDMSGEADEVRRHRPMRWLPLVPMVIVAGLIGLAIAFPMPRTIFFIPAPIIGTVVAIANNGPLGTPSIDDDKEKAALRNGAFRFCMAILAFLNIVGGPIIMLMTALHGWSLERVAGIAFTITVGNLAWFCCLPTLYASWKWPTFSEE